MAIMPSLFISSSAERNFTILLNRLPSERAIYSRLVSEKEDLMRERIKEQIRLPHKRFFQGKIPARQDLPDIDLAIISDVENVCIFLELKWFIEPAEVREVIEKSEEIQRGISQLLLLSQAISDDSDSIFNVLAIDSTYQLFFAVVSANSIGLARIQNPRIPVIRESHLVWKINSTLSLREVIGWLSNRSFLPIEGLHYEVVEVTTTIGHWSIEWYGIKPLIGEEFL